MALFGRSKEKKGDEQEHALPGYTAFAPEDVEDARRRRPDVDLSGYAAERGLEAIGSQNAAGYWAAMPLVERLQFNVLRGVLPGGAHGILFHHVVAWPAPGGSPMGGGRFYGTYFSVGSWWKPDVRDVLWDVPVVEWLVEGADHGQAHALGIPCTVAATLVPEAAGLTDFRIDNLQKPLKVLGHREKLGARGLDGWDVTARQEPDPRVVSPFLDRAASLLEPATARPYLELRFSHGTLLVRTNGYLREPQHLDWLGGLASALAAELRAAALAVAEPRAFADPLPAADWPEEGYSATGRHPPHHWLLSLHAYARANGMTLEDPLAYRSASPTVPVPGRTIAVMRGTLPGTAVAGRLAWHAERDVASANMGRTAALLPAAAGAPETQPWGERVAEQAINFSVRDGILAVWQLRSSGTAGDLGDVDGLIAKAVELARARGLAEA